MTSGSADGSLVGERSSILTLLRSGIARCYGADMKTLLGFLSPWALGAVAVWLVAMVVAYTWAIPIHANVGGPGLCPVEHPDCSPATFTQTQPDTTIFAIIVATIVAASLTATVLLVRRFSSHGGRTVSA